MIAFAGHGRVGVERSPHVLMPRCRGQASRPRSHGPADPHWRVRPITQHRLRPASISDTAVLRRTLLDGPDRLDADAAAWCVHAGIGYVHDAGPTGWPVRRCAHMDGSGTAGPYPPQCGPCMMFAPGL